jgi:hypothetical protein
MFQNYLLFTEQGTLMRRSTVMSLLVHLLFPDFAINAMNVGNLLMWQLQWVTSWRILDRTKNNQQICKLTEALTVGLFNVCGLDHKRQKTKNLLNCRNKEKTR